MVARYEGELYLDALYDWTWLLGKMSSADRVLNALSNSFLNPFANNRLKQRIKDLEAEILILKADHVTKAEKINEYETIQMFDALNMEGDSFAVMHSEPATDSNLPFRVCVSELAKEYCKYCKDDPYCSDVLQSCANTFFESSSCRPKICPMKDRGCRVVSTCLREGVVDEFQVSINKK